MYGRIFMNNTTRIIIAGIFGYTAYRISAVLSLL
nr:MAG TPA_asm: hypothetical protein [Bacteriophage sp.]